MKKVMSLLLALVMALSLAAAAPAAVRPPAGPARRAGR